MGENAKLSPGQWALWISDPDPPAQPMTPEQTVAERKVEMMALILKNHPELTPEDVQGLLDSFF